MATAFEELGRTLGRVGERGRARVSQGLSYAEKLFPQKSYGGRAVGPDALEGVDDLNIKTSHVRRRLAQPRTTYKNTPVVQDGSEGGGLIESAGKFLTDQAGKLKGGIDSGLSKTHENLRSTGDSVGDGLRKMGSAIGGAASSTTNAIGDFLRQSGEAQLAGNPAYMKATMSPAERRAEDSDFTPEAPSMGLKRGVPKFEESDIDAMGVADISPQSPAFNSMKSRVSAPDPDRALVVAGKKKSAANGAQSEPGLIAQAAGIAPKMPDEEAPTRDAAGKALQDKIAAGPGEAKGDLRDALLYAGLNMLRDSGNTSSWDAIANGAMAGFDRYDKTKGDAQKKMEDEYKRGVDGARVGYEVQGDKIGDYRWGRQEKRADRELEDRAAERADNRTYRERALGLQERQVNKPTMIDEIYRMESQIGGTPQEVAARVLDRVRPPRQSRIDPGVAKWAQGVLSDPTASGADRAKAMRALGLDSGENELDGLLD